MGVEPGQLNASLIFQKNTIQSLLADYKCYVQSSHHVLADK